MRRAPVCVFLVAALGCSCVERRVANLVSPNRFVRSRAHRKLQHLRKGQRAEAVRVLCEVVRGRSHLLDDLPGKYPLALRTRAAELLWRLKDPSAEGTLIWTLEAEELAPLREYAARGLALSESPRALAALERATTDADDDVRAAAVTSLYGRKGSEDVAALARVFHDDPDHRVREAAVRSLEWTSSPDAIPILLAASRDPQWAVRQCFACVGWRLAAQGLGEREITDACVQLLSDPLVARTACNSLRYIGNRRAVPALAAALAEHGRPEAARALGDLPDLRALPALCGALESGDSRLREAAAVALASYGSYGVERLAAALHDEEHHVRQAAARSLATIRTAGAAKTLLSAMFQADQPLRREPLEALDSFTHDPQWRGWSRDRWEQWWDEAEPRLEELDAAVERVASRSGKYAAVIRRHTISLLDRDGNELWTKLSGWDNVPSPFSKCRVSDLGWVLLRNRFISRTGEEPDVNPVRSWLPGEGPAQVATAAISPDGRLAAVLVAAGEKRAVVLCDEQGRALWTRPYLQEYASLAFSPDGRYLACLPGSPPWSAVTLDLLGGGEWTLTLFSRDGTLIAEIPGVSVRGLTLSIPAAEITTAPEAARLAAERVREALRGCGAVDCTPLARRMSGRRWLARMQPAEADVDLESIPWGALASGDGVLIDHFLGLFLFPRSSAPKLVDRLSGEDPQLRVLSFEVLRKMAGRSFGYFPDAPEAERARAIERWQSWAEAPVIVE